MHLVSISQRDESRTSYRTPKTKNGIAPSSGEGALSSQVLPSSTWVLFPVGILQLHAGQLRTDYTLGECLPAEAAAD